MAYQEFSNTTNGIRDILGFPNLDTPLVWPIILFTIFMIFFINSFFRELKREGKANAFSSLAVAGFVTSIIAVAISLLGLISTNVLVYTLVLSGVFIVIYLLSSKN